MIQILGRKNPVMKNTIKYIVSSEVKGCLDIVFFYLFLSFPSIKESHSISSCTPRKSLKALLLVASAVTR